MNDDDKDKRQKISERVADMNNGQVLHELEAKCAGAYEKLLQHAREDLEDALFWGQE